MTGGVLKMEWLPRSLKGWGDYLAYAAGIVIGFGVLAPVMETLESSLRKGE